MTTEEIQAYEADFIQFLQEECEVFDAAHDIKHLERVVRSAKHIATQEPRHAKRLLFQLLGYMIAFLYLRIILSGIWRPNMQRIKPSSF